MGRGQQKTVQDILHSEQSDILFLCMPNHHFLGLSWAMMVKACYHMGTNNALPMQSLGCMLCSCAFVRVAALWLD